VSPSLLHGKTIGRSLQRTLKSHCAFLCPYISTWTWAAFCPSQSLKMSLTLRVLNYLTPLFEAFPGSSQLSLLLVQPL
jgi:hypothetical protein